MVQYLFKLSTVFSRHSSHIGAQNNDREAMLVCQTNPVGVELFSYATAFFCSNKFAEMLATRVKTLYKLATIMKERSDVKFNTKVALYLACKDKIV